MTHGPIIEAAMPDTFAFFKAHTRRAEVGVLIRPVSFIPSGVAALGLATSTGGTGRVAAQQATPASGP